MKTFNKKEIIGKMRPGEWEAIDKYILQSESMASSIIKNKTITKHFKVNLLAAVSIHFADEACIMDATICESLIGVHLSRMMQKSKIPKKNGNKKQTH